MIYDSARLQFAPFMALSVPSFSICLSTSRVFISLP